MGKAKACALQSDAAGKRRRDPRGAPSPGDARALAAGVDFGFDFRVFGEAALLDFGVDQLVIDADFKAALIGGNQCKAGDVFLVCDEKLFRQTDGFALVASSRAVDQFYAHDRPPVGIGSG